MILKLVFLHGKTKNLGRYKTAEEAYEMYKISLIEKAGKFARF